MNANDFFFYHLGIVIMVIQHFVPTKTDNSCQRIYYQNVMAWVCGSFAVVGVVTSLAMIPVKIGKRRKSVNENI